MTREEKLKLNRDRQKAVRDAWKREVDLVKQEKGTVDWTEDQQMELLEKGRVSGYEGQHMKSVNEYPEYAASADNIQFLSHDDHLAAHNSGNEKSGYHSPTNGFYDSNTGIMHDFGENPPQAPEAFLLSNPIAHDDLKLLNNSNSKETMKENGDEMANAYDEFNEDTREDGAPVKVFKSYGNDTGISDHDYEQELNDIDRGIANAYEPYNNELSDIQNENDAIMNDETLSNQEKISELKSNRQEVENIGKSWSEESKEYYDNRNDILGKMSDNSDESSKDIDNDLAYGNSENNSFDKESDLTNDDENAESAFDDDFEPVNDERNEESAFDDNFESAADEGVEENAFEDGFESTNSGFGEQNTLGDSSFGGNTNSGLELESGSNSMDRGI